MKKRGNPFVKEAVTGYLFAAPAILGFLVLTLYPMLASLVYSFNKIDARGTMTFIGLDNYRYIFTNSSSEFMKSLYVTLLYAVVNVVLVIVYCLVISLLLNRRFFGRNFLRAIFYLPSVIPMLTTAILWQIIMQNQAQGGLLNQLLMSMGLNTQNWLGDTRLIFVVLWSMSLWTCGGTIVVFLATLQDVPKEQMEAIEVDGGNFWHKFVHVTYQTIKPVLFFQMIMCMITSLQVFTQSVALSQNGAPDRMTYFLNVMIYQHSFKELGMRGVASAEAWIIFLVTVVLTVILFGLQGSFKKDDSMGKTKRRERR